MIVWGVSPGTVCLAFKKEFGFVLLFPFCNHVKFQQRVVAGAVCVLRFFRGAIYCFRRGEPVGQFSDDYRNVRYVSDAGGGQPVGEANVVACASEFRVKRCYGMLPCLLVRSNGLRFLARGDIKLACNFRAVTYSDARAACAWAKTKGELTVCRFVERTRFRTANAGFVLRRLAREFCGFRFGIFKRATCVVVELRRFDDLHSTFRGVQVGDALAWRVSAIRLAYFLFGCASGLATSGLAFLLEVFCTYRFVGGAVYGVCVGGVHLRLVARCFGRVFEFALARRPVVRIRACRIVPSYFRGRDDRREAIGSPQRDRWRFLITCLALGRLCLVVSRIHRVPIDFDLTDVRGREFCDDLGDFGVIYGFCRFRYTDHFIVANDRGKGPRYVSVQVCIGDGAIGRVIQSTVSGGPLCIKWYFRFFCYSIIEVGLAVRSWHASDTDRCHVLVAAWIGSGGRILFRLVLFFWVVLLSMISLISACLRV